MMKLVSKTIKIASYCLLGLIICLSLIVMIYRFMGKSPSICGYSFYYVLTESMEPEIMPGEVILGEAVDFSELQVGDIVTYTGQSGELAGKVITHKIVSIDGSTVTTQGVANAQADPPVDAGQIMSRYVATIPLVGTLFSLMSSTPGFLILVVLPLVLLIANEVSIIVKACKKDKEEHLSE